MNRATEDRIFALYRALRHEGFGHKAAIDGLCRSDYDYLSRNELKRIIKLGKSLRLDSYERREDGKGGDRTIDK